MRLLARMADFGGHFAFLLLPRIGVGSTIGCHGNTQERLDHAGLSIPFSGLKDPLGEGFHKPAIEAGRGALHQARVAEFSIGVDQGVDDDCFSAVAVNENLRPGGQHFVHGERGNNRVSEIAARRCKRILQDPRRRRLGVRCAYVEIIGENALASEDPKIPEAAATISRRRRS